MWKGNRFVFPAILGIASLCLMVAGILIGAKFFSGETAETSVQDTSHLPQQARDALADIAAVAEALDGLQDSVSREEVQAIRSSLEAMGVAIRELPSDSDFSYGPLMQAEIASLLERCVAVRRREVVTPKESPETNRDEMIQGMESLFAQRRQARLEAREGEALGDPSAMIEIRTKVSPAMLSLERELEELRSEVERQRSLHQQQILETEFESDLPDIEKLLVAFTTPGLTYTTPDGKRDQNDGTARPVSLSFLKKYGCLKSNRQSLERLLSAASRVERPRGHLPRQWGGDMSHLDMGIKSVQRAEQLLIKYGDLLVKKRLLSK